MNDWREAGNAPYLKGLVALPRCFQVVSLVCIDDVSTLCLVFSDLPLDRGLGRQLTSPLLRNVCHC